MRSKSSPAVLLRSFACLRLLFHAYRPWKTRRRSHFLPHVPGEGIEFSDVRAHVAWTRYIRRDKIHTKRKERGSKETDSGTTTTTTTTPQEVSREIARENRGSPRRSLGGLLCDRPSYATKNEARATLSNANNAPPPSLFVFARSRRITRVEGHEEHTWARAHAIDCFRLKIDPIVLIGLSQAAIRFAQSDITQTEILS